MLKAVRLAAVGLGWLVLATLGCGLAFNGSDVLVLTKVNVPGGTGSASVMFQGIRGQQVLVSLTGNLSMMEPFAELVGPNGGETSLMQANGDVFNSAEVSLPTDGVYRLNVFDGSGHGGAVTVRVELASNIPTTNPAS